MIPVENSYTFSTGLWKTIVETVENFISTPVQFL
jgi:hypothetical protein